MTTAQIAVLKKCIEAERLYWRRLAAAQGKYISPDCRLVEVSLCNGVNRRTVTSLEKAGLVESAVRLGGQLEQAGGGVDWYIRLAHNDVNYIEEPQQFD